MIRAVVIRGHFDTEDWQDLVALLRTINERHRDTRHFEICAVDPDATSLELSQAVLASLSDKPVGRA